MGVKLASNWRQIGHQVPVDDVGDLVVDDGSPSHCEHSLAHQAHHHNFQLWFDQRPIGDAFDARIPSSDIQDDASKVFHCGPPSRLADACMRVLLFSMKAQPHKVLKVSSPSTNKTIGLT